MENETITCPSCSIEYKTSLGYVRCPQCNKPFSSKITDNRANSDAWTIKGIFKRYEGQIIGINYKHPTEYNAAQLVRANEDYFSIRAGNLFMHFPYEYVMSIAESKVWIKPNAVTTEEFNLVVTVERMVVYKGGIGFSIPL